MKGDEDQGVDYKYFRKFPVAPSWNMSDLHSSNNRIFTLNLVCEIDYSFPINSLLYHVRNIFLLLRVWVGILKQWYCALSYFVFFISVWRNLAEDYWQGFQGWGMGQVRWDTIGDLSSQYLFISAAKNPHNTDKNSIIIKLHNCSMQFFSSDTIIFCNRKPDHKYWSKQAEINFSKFWYHQAIIKLTTSVSLMLLMSWKWLIICC